MRHDQSRFRHPLTPVQNQIEIERSRRAGGGTDAAVLPLDVEQPIEHRPRRQACLSDHHAVQISRLRADADGSGIKRR